MTCLYCSTPGSDLCDSCDQDIHTEMLVIWSEKQRKGEPLDAKEVFRMAVENVMEDRKDAADYSVEDEYVDAVSPIAR